MAVTIPSRTASTRRTVLKRTVATAAYTAIGGVACPSISFAPDRPQITHGVQSGDVSADSGMVWARADRPSRMLVEVATTDTFREVRRAVFVDALPESDFTAKTLIDDLPPAQDIFYRISFQDLSSAVFSESQIGHFRTGPRRRSSISFLWSGDGNMSTNDLNDGLNVDFTGLPTFATGGYFFSSDINGFYQSGTVTVDLSNGFHYEFDPVSDSDFRGFISTEALDSAYFFSVDSWVSMDHYYIGGAVPAPGALALLGLAGLMRRRRR